MPIPDERRRIRRARLVRMTAATWYVSALVRAFERDPLFEWIEPRRERASASSPRS